MITLVQGGGIAEVNAAVEAAHRAFQADWRWRTPAERAALLLKAADVLAEHADELALLESQENGKPVANARSNDINFLIGVLGFSRLEAVFLTHLHADHVGDLPGMLLYGWGVREGRDGPLPPIRVYGPARRLSTRSAVPGAGRSGWIVVSR